MTILIRVLVLVLTAVLTTVNAQNFQGVATYKTQRKVDIKLDSTQMNSEMQAKMMEMMKKQFQKTYLLSFNKEASIYKEEESLDKPQIGDNGFQVQMLGGGGADILFKNTKEKRYTDQKDTMGKIFLVKDELEPINWKLESDSKFIGEYQCYKATYTKKVEKSKVFSNRGTTNKDEKDKEQNWSMKSELLQHGIHHKYQLTMDLQCTKACQV